MHRSYLFAPGHNEKLLTKVFDAGATDLEVVELRRGGRIVRPTE